MATFKGLISHVKRGPRDIVGIDFASSGVHCVHVRLINNTFAVSAVDVLPQASADLQSQNRLRLPRHLAARYASICISSKNAIIKLLNLPGQLGNDAQKQIKEYMGIGEGNYRIGYRVISYGQTSRAETKLLAVAIPDAEVQPACALFASGWPVPISVELAELAILTAFQHGAGAAYKAQAVGVIELGDRATSLAFFNKGELVLVRRFDFGYCSLLDQIQKGLAVDAATAENILSDSSFDISQHIKQALEPFLKQLVISQHFIERRENCQIVKFFIPSNKKISGDWLKELKAAVGQAVERWDPFENLSLAPEAIPASLAERRFCFTAALGAALGSFGESMPEPETVAR